MNATYKTVNIDNADYIKDDILSAKGDILSAKDVEDGMGREEGDPFAD